MKLVLPPGLSPQGFDGAVKALQGAVGAGWVMTSDEDRDAYADIYAPGPETLWGASGAVAPANVEEVQAVVRIANEHKLPLWIVARGKNLGYGTAAPRMPGSMVLDLGRMDRIIEIDPELGYCVIEPGVGFLDLYEHIQREKLPLMMSVPGNGWGSVLGNALDHGIGYTPYGVHASNLCGMEVVLANGELVRTGLGAMENNKAAHLFPFSYGPSWDQMFTQSNLGVVTKAGMWLMPEPETSVELNLEIPNAEDIGWVIDTLTPLRLNRIIDQSIFIPSWLGKMTILGQRKDFWDKPGAIPEWRVQELLKEHKLSYWNMQLRLYGEESVTKAKAEVVKAAFAKHLKTPIGERWWRKGDPTNVMDLTLGVPSAVPLQMGDWVGGRSAHMGFSPVVPATGKHVLDQMRRSRKIINDHDVDFYASFTIGGRFCNNVNMLMYDRDNEKQVETIKTLFNALIADAAAHGYAEYRTHLGWMDAISDTFGFNDHAMRRMTEKVKDTLDPNGILSPGKNGIWPSAYAAQRGKALA
ncbi:MAG: FAD-binding oxidoreductase [Alphaproteobacteria bacterium]|nr:FAD-binding oxidoreductase [Alphaproteobacteria bacterium]MBU0792849.1 FAD-binding oxidoreductase [Alphaproteobacteria bacterium]MBU0874453.1 FAD-binding oxidoreductase [Alphaproteobacteria bacterium]MBU1769082.1 FAD-binding oxidoreductase [Alphaproteobacteria bacterium]